MEGLIELVERVMARYKAHDMRAYPMDALCGNCSYRWGEHVGLNCPTGESGFVPKREIIMQEIDNNEEKIR